MIREANVPQVVKDSNDLLRRNVFLAQTAEEGVADTGGEDADDRGDEKVVFQRHVPEQTAAQP